MQVARGRTRQRWLVMNAAGAQTRGVITTGMGDEGAIGLGA